MPYGIYWHTGAFDIGREETLGSNNIHSSHFVGGRILCMSNHPVYLSLHSQHLVPTLQYAHRKAAILLLLVYMVPLWCVANQSCESVAQICSLLRVMVRTLDNQGWSIGFYTGEPTQLSTIG